MNSNPNPNIKSDTSKTDHSNCLLTTETYDLLLDAFSSEEKKSQHMWTGDAWRIQKADATTGPTTLTEPTQNGPYPGGNVAVDRSWCPYHGSLKKRAQRYHFGQYTKKRDMQCIYAKETSRWFKYCLSLATLTRMKSKSPRHIDRRTKHLYDWMAHASNLAKSEPSDSRTNRYWYIDAYSVHNRRYNSALMPCAPGAHILR